MLGGTTFNGKHILGTDATALNFQVGANTTADDTITVTSADMTADSTITAVTGTAAVIDSSATAGAIATVIDNLDTALDTVNNTRATFGATQSRFDAVIANLQSRRGEPERRAQPHHGRGLRQPKRPTCRARRSCSRPAPRWSPRPTSCRSKCCRCCADLERDGPAPSEPEWPSAAGLFRCRRRIWRGETPAFRAFASLEPFPQCLQRHSAG